MATWKGIVRAGWPYAVTVGVVVGVVDAGLGSYRSETARAERLRVENNEKRTAICRMSGLDPVVQFSGDRWYVTGCAPR